MTSAIRRHHDKRAKAKARRIMLLWNRSMSPADAARWMTPRAVGVNASTHCRPCSCWMCTNGKGEPTRQEMVADDAAD